MCVCVCVCVLSTVKPHFKVFLVPFFYNFKTLPLHSGYNTSIQLIHRLNRDIDGENPQTIPDREVLVLSAEARSEMPAQTHAHSSTIAPAPDSSELAHVVLMIHWGQLDLVLVLFIKCFLKE